MQLIVLVVVLAVVFFVAQARWIEKHGGSEHEDGKETQNADS